MTVDDDPDGAFLLQRCLTRNIPDAEIVPFGNGLAALDYLENHPVDAIVTDHRMAEMEGITLIEHIRERDQKVPIVMITGMLHLEDAALQVGANRFLPSTRWREIADVLRPLLESPVAGHVKM